MEPLHQPLLSCVGRINRSMFAPRPEACPNFSFPIQCNWLKLNGSWPVQAESTKFAQVYRYWSVFAICLVAATCWFQTWYMFENFGDILKVTENCCTSFMGLQSLFRLIHMWLNKKKMKQLIGDFVRYIYVHANENKTRGAIRRQCDNELNVYRVMSAMLFALICMYCVLPLIELFSSSSSPERPFPYKMIFPYPAQRGLPYIVTYFYTSVAGFIAVSTLLAEDSLFGFFIIHACGQFKVLHSRIEKVLPAGHQAAIQKYGKASLKQGLVQSEYHVYLRSIIREHNILIRFCTDLDGFCSPYLLVNFFISSVLICVVGFQLVTVRMSLGDSLKFLLYILSALAQLFIICWSGDKLITNSVATGWKLYACNWEHVSVQGRRRNAEVESIEEVIYPPDVAFLKCMLFMMLRAQRPLHITALKFSVLSLQSFTKILSTSLSYFTLLQTVYEKE